jgi:hypothetical protein
MYSVVRTFLTKIGPVVGYINIYHFEGGRGGGGQLHLIVKILYFSNSAKSKNNEELIKRRPRCCLHTLMSSKI